MNPDIAVPATSADLPPAVLHTRDARGVHSLVLNRPATFNALSEEMLAALQAALDAVALDASARIVVLSAQGKAFCAGHNLKEMRAQPELAYYQKLFAQCTRMMLSIQHLPVPVIAKVQALATAAGVAANVLLALSARLAPRCAAWQEAAPEVVA